MKLLKIKILIPAQTCCWSPTHIPSTAPGSMGSRQEPATTFRSPRSWRGRQWSRPGIPSRQPVTVSQRQRLSEHTSLMHIMIFLHFTESIKHDKKRNLVWISYFMRDWPYYRQTYRQTDRQPDDPPWMEVSISLWAVSFVFILECNENASYWIQLIVEDEWVSS